MSNHGGLHGFSNRPSLLCKTQQKHKVKEEIDQILRAK